MTRTAFGDCIGCNEPIRPPYLSFAVMRLEQIGDRGETTIHNWEEIDVCDGCAAKLTANDLHRLVSAEGAEA